MQQRQGTGRASPRQQRQSCPPDKGVRPRDSREPQSDDYELWRQQREFRGRVYDVWHWFARDPRACVADAEAQTILRQLDHQLRSWFQYPTPEEINAARTVAERHELKKQRNAVGDEQVRRQHIRWWDDLRNQLLRVGVPASSADSFADYLSGYTMVRDRDQAKSVKEPIRLVLSRSLYRLESAGEPKKGRVLPEWRRAKRLAKTLGFPPSPTTHPSQRQSLKTTLTHLMIADLKVKGASLARAAETVNSLWGLIGEASDEFDPRSVARAKRRARQRRNHRK